MAIPWLRLIDAGIGLVNYARSRRTPANALAVEERLEARQGLFGGLETRLTGVVVGALREAFDRDARRTEMVRQHLEAKRLRAERALKLELLRQAADREIGRLRLLAGVAAASFLATLLLITRVVAGSLAGRVMIGFGWALLLAALGIVFVAQFKVEDALDRELPPSTEASEFAPWLIVAALAFIGIAALIA